MQSCDPVILKGVKESILESLLVFILLLCIAKISAEALSEFAQVTYRFIDIEAKWQTHCVDADSKDWGQYCHWLKLRIQPNPVIFAIKNLVAILVSAMLLSCVCRTLT